MAPGPRVRGVEDYQGTHDLRSLHGQRPRDRAAPVMSHDGHGCGWVTRPRNRMLPERLSRIKNTNGWSARKVGMIGADVRLMPTPVAAAASVPSSLTSTNALCTTTSIKS